MDSVLFSDAYHFLGKIYQFDPICSCQIGIRGSFLKLASLMTLLNQRFRCLILQGHDQFTYNESGYWFVSGENQCVIVVYKPAFVYENVV